MKEPKNGWTPERRAAQRERILKNRPWEKSTGPRSHKGKTRSAKNATRHGKRSLEARMIQKLMRENADFLKQVDTLGKMLYARMLSDHLANELTKEVKRSR